MSFLAAIFAILRPLVASVIVKLVERYQSDPQFKAELDKAAGLVKTAQTKEEKLDAAKAYQDALFR